jgi:ribosome-associated protein
MIVEPEQAKEWARLAAQAADDKKATNTVILEVGQVLAITDYFVITTGANSRQVRTIADEIELQLKELAGLAPLRTEGRRDLSWVLIDYGSIVVHVFSAEMREFYDIERLYRDVPSVTWEPTAPIRKVDAS